ncbi:RHS repeat-associated core domain-containing protein [Nonomuraea angiospora]|uniref:RHS repeat-associated core domain-containing protein n=1 Tax=Nonomuraea angiospora TaxID=46172 RepID=UPI0034303879
MAGRVVRALMVLVLAVSGLVALPPAAWAEVELRDLDMPKAVATTVVNGKPLQIVDHTEQSAATAGTLRAGSSGAGGGDFTATGLTPAGEYAHGGSSGGFTWSYPIQAPQVPGGLVPELELSYSSQDVDGRTAATNNQPGWAGDGWTLSPGFIERRYVTCVQDDSGGNDPAHKVGDLCWKRHNATLNLNGSTTELVRDDATGAWRKKLDDGTRVELLTGADNGDDDGEYWRVTDPDGVQYHFGRHKLPGWSTGKPVTDSAWTVPVFGNHAGEPCRAAAFADSWCRQAWRWNLDYVVDPRGNAMAYFWAKESNRYDRAINASFEGTPTAYVRGGHLKTVEYGMRGDTVFTASIGARISFGVSERCLPREGVTCDWSAVTAATARNWPDVPFDQYCAEGAAGCAGRAGPSFWTTKRLTSITSYLVYDGSVRKVDSWALAHSFPATGDGSAAPLWLKSITRTGHTGSTPITLPAVRFFGIQLPNRVAGAVDAVPPLNRYRVYGIRTDTGATIGVTYSQPDCSASSLPSPASNTRRCFPVMWSPPEAPGPDYEPYADWFHTYVVTQLLRSDDTGGAPVVRTDYRYLGGMAWGRDEDDFVPAGHRTYGQRRGYGRVQVLTGDPGEGRQMLAETRYFRGVPDAPVADGEGGNVADQPEFAGLPRERATYLGDGGELTSAASQVPWRSAATATQARPGLPALTARQVAVATEHTRERLSDGIWRRTRTDTAVDAHGLPRQVAEQGDTAVTGDETCTLRQYARNTDLNVLTTVSETKTVAGGCSATQVVSAERVYYDGSGTLGAAPTRGLPTRYDGLTPDGTGYRTDRRLTYDQHGRPLTETDASGGQTTTSYTPATGPAPTSAVTTNPLGHRTVTELGVRGQTTAVVDPNGVRTDVSYDALGRTTEVWQPGWPKAANPGTPSVRYSYRVSTTEPNVITTETLDRTGSYRATHAFFDGLLRERQTQAPAADTATGRLVSAILYDTAGRPYKEYDPFFAAGAPSRTLIAATGDNVVPAAVRREYDGQGRTVRELALKLGDEESRTTTVYDGAERTTVIPPAGATATTTIADAHGRTVERRSYTDAARTRHQTTGYRYDVAGNMTAMTDPAGNEWRWTFDRRGNQTVTEDPDRGVTRTTYDVLDRAVTVTDARGVTLTTAYDPLDRPVTVGQGDTVRARWTYDTVKLGQPATQTRYAGDAAYVSLVTGYDDRYQPTALSVTLPAAERGLAGTYTWTYGYNARTGTRDWVTHPAMGGLPEERVTTETSVDGLPKRTLVDQQPLVSWVNYSPLGQVLRTTYGEHGEQVYDTRDWDDHTGALTRQTVDGDVALRVQDTRYTYDQAGNVKRISAVSGQGERASADNQCFATDALRRLTTAWTTADAAGTCADAPTSATAGGPDGYWHSYSYDLAGNRASETRHPVGAATAAVTSTYTVGTAGRERPSALRSVTVTGGRSETFAYDEAGNLTARQGAGRDRRLTWNAENRLDTITEDGKTTGYVYDTAGSRLIARAADGSATAYLPEGNELTLAAGGAKTAVRHYLHGGEPVAVRTGASLMLLFGDHQGTALVTVEWGATQTTRHRKQLPFGGRRGAAVAWPGERGFLSATEDPTGTTHLNAREYDADLGRFLSVDPVLVPDDARQVNAYQYGGQNPATFSDPSGAMLPECWSGQYKCGYDGRGRLKEIDFGKNYERETRASGGTPSPRWVAREGNLQRQCRNDPGCIGTPSQLAAQREAAARRAREAARAQQVANGNIQKLASALLAAGAAGQAALATMGDWLESFRETLGSLPDNRFVRGATRVTQNEHFQFLGKTFFWSGILGNFAQNYQANNGNIPKSAFQTSVGAAYDFGLSVAGMYGGAALGAAAGMPFGPPGVVAGGVIGAGAGVIGGAFVAFRTSPWVTQQAGRLWDGITGGWW